ncbi:anti sigma factor C-terminal domain-containing protein [Bacillus sp. ISL-41]|uniref:anti sigma factor C-terminal domain-containing protein n=1 Tax=Bacillus sp. ISL-41 TaxID=2819127 RepID=UPI001BEA26B6|nr:anti sigma factor C-terminal domain-containing protein [Bacillus sp. ISL-41]MBT2644709.1 anti sigma factor C-terminal domain-containing protein [Bacillus sp. ISL-41]
MTKNNRENKPQDIDFMSSPSMQRAIRKSRMKQTIKYTVIAFLASTVLLTVVFIGSDYLMNKKLRDNKDFMQRMVKGANITGTNTYYIHNLFSVLGETTYYKEIGGRKIVWDKTTKKIPLFGRTQTIHRGSGMVATDGMDEEAKRTVRYNDFNNERKIDFYYPGLTYDFLPKELDLAAGLDQNMLVEVALSFKEPMTLDKLSKTLGHENVNWLWVDTTTESQRAKMSDELDSDSLKVKGGGNAFGFEVTEAYPYSADYGPGYIDELELASQSNSSAKQALKAIKSNAKNGELLISGAVVTGTPEELKRFRKLDFIRASVLGVTIDKY